MWRNIACLTVLTLALLPSPVWGQYPQEETIQLASAVLQENVSVPLNGIPRSILANSHGIAIIPNVLKGGFVIGARHGKGVLITRDDNGNWRAPVFIKLTGGNIGWQIGVQATDVILVFKTRKSINGILSGKFTLGADAAASAGPVGRNASAATDQRLQAEIYSYSRSRGLFAGLSIDGSVLRVDRYANAAYYRSPAPGVPVTVPPSAIRLVEAVAAYAVTPGQPTAVPAGDQTENPGQFLQELVTEDATTLRGQLAQSDAKLQRILNGEWTAYLALPAQVFGQDGHPSPESLLLCIGRFEAVTANATYASLASRPEFQSTFDLLKRYHMAISRAKPPLNLPPPPDGQAWNQRTLK